MPHAPPAVSLPKFHRFKQFCGIDTKDVENPLGPVVEKNIIEISHIFCFRMHCHQVERRRDTSSEETYTTPRRFWLEKSDAMRVLIMDQWREFKGGISRVVLPLSQFPIVCDIESLWQNVVTERHGTRFKITFQKAWLRDTNDRSRSR